MAVVLFYDYTGGDNMIIFKVNKHGIEHIVMIDDCDAWIIERYSFFIDKDGYCICSYREDGKNKKIRLHRLIMNAKSGEIVDHNDRNKLNCQRYNLSIVSSRDNTLNTKVSCINKSGYKGISWCKHANKWHIRVNVDGLNKHIAYESDFEKAKEIRKQSELQYYGKYVQDWDSADQLQKWNTLLDEISKFK